jgi:cellulose synthase/poly-beta-1,6-N-acetylglucosamine synthase-like glycosyltransferase
VIKGEMMQTSFNFISDGTFPLLGFSVIVSLYVLCSAVLLIYGVQCYTMTILFIRKRKSRLPIQREIMRLYDDTTKRHRFPSVVIQLPMYNEKTVAARIIETVGKMNYPRDKFEIQVLDDSTDETRSYIDTAAAEQTRRGVRISVIRRDNREGYKAGALQNGLLLTEAEFVAIFDADFVPPADFLRKAMPFFHNRPKLGLVQGRWTHLNRSASLITRGQAIGIDGHFMIEQAARCWNNLFMNFNGTAGVFRRTAIEDSGGWQHDTLTEDMDLSYRMQLRGWETEFVPDLEVPAEIPEDINAFKNQQFRWAKGSIQTALKLIPQLNRTKMSLFKRYQALLHLTHYTVHPLMLMLAILTLPVFCIVKVQLSPVLFGLTVLAMVLATSGPSTMYVVAQYSMGNNIGKMMLFIPVMMLIGTGLAVNNARAVWEAVIGKKSPFHRTPKIGEKRTIHYKPIKDIAYLLELFVGFYCCISLYLFIEFTSIAVSPFLILYAAGFLFVGTLSVIHLKIPALIGIKLSFLKKSK